MGYLQDTVLGVCIDKKDRSESPLHPKPQTLNPKPKYGASGLSGKQVSVQLWGTFKVLQQLTGWPRNSATINSAQAVKLRIPAVIWLGFQIQGKCRVSGLNLMSRV